MEEGVVAPERRVQRRGNERLPALHHSQGLPQSAGGQGQRPHVSFLLPCLLPPQCVCVCAFLLVTEKNECVWAPRESLQIREMIKTRLRKKACMQSMLSWKDL